MKILKWIKDLFSDQKKTTVSVSGNSIHKEKDVMNIEAENSDVKIENYHLSNLVLCQDLVQVKMRNFSPF